ncbi:MAG: sensor histidine kinase [Defluviitaleaceae bacterium]|nr:sensor histidine kinase [Defluviitaleaceae bacterium]
MNKLLDAKHLLPIGALILVIAVFLGLGMTLIDTNTVKVYSADGVWDLTHMDLSVKTVRLHGDVLYIPDALVSPMDFARMENQAKVGSPDNLSVVTSRMRVYTACCSWYTFSNLLDGYAHRIYVNGEWMLDVGTFGTTPETSRPGTARVVFTAQPIGGVIELVIQSLTYLHRVDNLGSYWYVGDQGLISNVRRIDFVSSLVLGCFLALFIVYMMLYFLRRDYLANLYIALFSLISLLRFGVREPSIFSAVFAQLSWYAEYRLEYLTVSVMGWLLTAVAAELLPTIIPKYFRVVLYTASFIFSVIFLLGDVNLINNIILYCYIFYMAAILYEMIQGLYTIIKNFRKINLEQSILILGFALLLFSVLYSYGNYSGVNTIPVYATLSTMKISLIVHVLFCFFLAAAVFIANTKDMENAKAAEYQIATEVNSLVRLNQMKTELMANISHEARTPLAILASYSGLVAMELKERNESEQIVANLDKIVEEAKRVASLIESMNKLTLDGTMHKTRIHFNLGEAIKQTAGLYQHIYKRSNIQLNLAIDDGLMVFANPEEVTQVLFNLLQNAKDHAEEGSVSITAKKEGSDVVVLIADTGAGVPPGLLPQLFERGVSGTQFGKGIGLSICKDVVDAHGGSISIESEVSGENKGTRVTLILPGSHVTEDE